MQRTKFLSSSLGLIYFSFFWGTYGYMWCIEARGLPHVSSSVVLLLVCLFFYFLVVLRWCLLLTWISQIQLVGQWAHVSSCFCPLALGLQAYTIMPHFLHRCWGVTHSGVCVYVAVTLLTEPCSQLQAWFVSIIPSFTTLLVSISSFNSSISV